MSKGNPNPPCEYPQGWINVADLKDPDDPQGRTYRAINADKEHKIPIGALVEVVSDPEYPNENDGIRLFVVFHGRDCDQTPLYSLSPNKNDLREKPGFGEDIFANRKWVNGYSEESLKVIRLPDGIKET